MLKGTPIIYNGEEIGMENYPFKSPKDFKDVNAKMIFENSENVEEAFNMLKETSRDHARTVMQWDESQNAGFSSREPWTYVNKNYKMVNVQKAIKDKNSILNNYARILATRNEYGDLLTNAKYKFYCKKGCVGYKIIGDNLNLEVIANLSEKGRPLNLSEATLLYSNMTNKNKTLKPYQIVILKYNS